MERQAELFEAKVKDLTDQANALLAQADALHQAALALQAKAAQEQQLSIQATQAAVTLTAQASAAQAQAASDTAQALTLTAAANALRTQAAADEELAIQQRAIQDQALAQATTLLAQEQTIRTNAATALAAATAQADAAHQAMLTAQAAADAAEVASIAATQLALADTALADQDDASAALETQLAAQAQAQVDYYASLQGQLGGFTETLFAYDLSGHLLGEYGTDGSAKVEYAWLEDLPLAQLRSISVYWVQADHLNTPTQLTDANQLVVWDAVREPFGKTATAVSSVDNRLRFPGQYEDGETGLSYNYFRDFDPGTGRYIESDPIGLKGGINIYLYSNGRPLKSVDSTGKSPISDCFSAQSGNHDWLQCVRDNIVQDSLDQTRAGLSAVGSDVAESAACGFRCSATCIAKIIPGQLQGTAEEEILEWGAKKWASVVVQEGLARGIAFYDAYKFYEDAGFVAQCTVNCVAKGG